MKTITEDEAAAGLGALFGDPMKEDPTTKERLAKWEKYYAEVRKDQLVLNIAHFKVENEEMAKKYAALQKQLLVERDDSRKMLEQAHNNTKQAFEQADKLLKQRDNQIHEIENLHLRINSLEQKRDELLNWKDGLEKHEIRMREVADSLQVQLQHARACLHDLTE